MASSLAAPATSPFALGESFYLPAGETACLLIHGFTATPQEMRYLGSRLQASGLTVYGVRVAGHATSVEDLERSSWPEWRESVTEQLLVARRQHRHVVLVGQSMGGLLALAVAAQRPDDVTAIALLAPAIILQRRWLRSVRPLLPWISRVGGGRFRYLAKGQSDIADPAGHVGRETYDRVPLRALHQLLALQHHVRRQLRRVRQPALVIHSRQDHTCAPESVRHLQRRLAGPVETLLLDASYHVVSVDYDRDRVADAVGSFAQRNGRHDPGPSNS